MRRSLGKALSMLVLSFVVIVIGKYVIVAQNAVTGEWKANTKSEKQENTGKIHIEFERKTEHGRNVNGTSYAYDELQGLSREQAQNGRVSFRLVREAGTVDCEGTFANGSGVGIAPTGIRSGRILWVSPSSSRRNHSALQ